METTKTKITKTIIAEPVNELEFKEGRKDAIISAKAENDVQEIEFRMDYRGQTIIHIPKKWVELEENFGIKVDCSEIQKMYKSAVEKKIEELKKEIEDKDNHFIEIECEIDNLK